jgi:hypothetical protein
MTCTSLQECCTRIDRCVYYHHRPLLKTDNMRCYKLSLSCREHGILYKNSSERICHLKYREVLPKERYPDEKKIGSISMPAQFIFIYYTYLSQYILNNNQSIKNTYNISKIYKLNQKQIIRQSINTSKSWLIFLALCVVFLFVCLFLSSSCVLCTRMDCQFMTASSVLYLPFLLFSHTDVKLYIHCSITYYQQILCGFL